MELNKIICGKNLEVMAGLPADSADTIITDPPYGIGFMGKDWDTFKLGYKSDNWDGYDKDPKISASMQAGKYDHSRNIEFQRWFTLWGIEALRVLKPGGTLLMFGGTRTYHRLTCAIEDAGFIIKDCIMWLYGSGFPKATDIAKQVDKKHGHTPDDKEAGYCICGLQHDFPYTPEAKLWDGRKSHGLKPAYEPILVAVKPNDGTYANNALVHGVSGLNIEGCRIGLDGEKQPTGSGGAVRHSATDHEWGFVGNGGNQTPPTGRFPANVILDEEAAAMLDEQSGVLKTGDLTGQPRSENKIFGSASNTLGTPQFNKGDKGGASRFFYCAKASKSERNAGCEGLPKGKPPASARSKPAAGRNAPLGESRHNHHPTVKPLALMIHLCNLTKTPTGGVVLDPFAGSGTTCVACVHTGRDFIGIEKKAEYCEIARKRIEAAKSQYALFE